MQSYQYPYTVNLDDLDFMGHVGHAKWLIILMHARVSYFSQSGISFQELLNMKMGIVVSEIQIKYLRPAFFEDQLTITMTAHDLFKKGFSLDYNVKNQHGLECVKADIKLVFVNHEGKSIEVPKQVEQFLFG